MGASKISPQGHSLYFDPPWTSFGYFRLLSPVRGTVKLLNLLQIKITQCIRLQVLSHRCTHPWSPSPIGDRKKHKRKLGDENGQMYALAYHGLET